MLTAEENERLTSVGPGTPMGDLLRRYWQPIAAAAEFTDEHRIKPLRLMGEDLVLYRDLAGTWGLIERWCAHRGTDLSMGRVEDCGIRCMRHGWIYMENGQCLDMPLEEEPFAAEVKMNGYPVAEAGGLVWGYLGPQPAPLVPDWAPFAWQDGLTQIVYADLPCNWLQCQESALDPIAVEWLQAYSTADGQMAPPPSQPRVRHRGVRARLRLQAQGRRGVERRPYRPVAQRPVRRRRALVPSRMARAGGRNAHARLHALLRQSSAGHAPAQGPQRLLVRQRCRTTRANGSPSRVLNRTFTIWLEQGAVLDRTREHLVDSDRGINVMRDKYATQMSMITDGAEPKAVLRDPDANHRLRLPDSKARFSPQNTSGDFPYLEGMPDDVARLYHRVVQSWLPPEQRTKPKRRRKPPEAELPYQRSF